MALYEALWGTVFDLADVRIAVSQFMFDIQRTVDYLRKEISETDDTELKFELGREAARYQWQLDLMSYHKDRGTGFFNHAAWSRKRAFAWNSWLRSRDRHRRKMGDLEILERLASVGKSERLEGGYHLTKSRCKVIAAVVRLATDSGMIYCSYAGLARSAGVSERTACSVRSELEGLGVLVRVRTGGRSASGENQSNKYFVRYNTLRDVLGIANRWEERRDDALSPFRAWAMLRKRPNRFCNYEGFARCSCSARQKRRLAQRTREAEKHRRTAANVIVENPAPTWLPRVVENPENGMFDQVFCALTKLSTRKRSFLYQPERSLLLILDTSTKISTRQSRSLYEEPPTSTWCFDIQRFSNRTLNLLSKIDYNRINPLLSEIDQMTRESPTPKTSRDMQFHAESLLHLLADADKSLFNRTALDRIGRGSAARQ